MKTILLPVGVYLPGHKGGGPIRSLSNLVERLGDEAQFKVLTSDENLADDTSFVAEFGKWQRVGKAQVRYLRKWERTLPYLMHLLATVEYDAIYLNAFWPTPFTLPVVLMKRAGLLNDVTVIIAPRGQFYPGAFRQKMWKKWPFLKVSQWAGLFDNIVWQATNEEEFTQLERVFGDTGTVRLAPNLGSVPDVKPDHEFEWPIKKRDELSLVFLSRISRKKNLKKALELVGALEGDVTFDIYGPVWDDEYWAECERVIEGLPSNIRVRSHGSVPHKQVFEIFAQHDVFLFPTQAENFGHVIFESLVAGCPVLLSDQTPWRRLEELGVGWDLELDDEQGFREALQWCVKADDEEFRPMREASRQYAMARARAEEDVELNRALFLGELS